MITSKSIPILDQLRFYKKAHKADREYQLWQEGIKPKLIQSDTMMIKLINYIHNNPIKRGYIDEACIGDIAVIGIMKVCRA